jgi:transposase
LRGPSAKHVGLPRGRKHDISPSLLFRWRQRTAEGGREAVQVNDEVIGAAKVRHLEEKVRELERLLGRKTLEVEILKEARSAARQKPLLRWPSPHPDGSR